jgi:predicted DNA-binding WGR domain protein
MRDAQKHRAGMSIYPIKVRKQSARAGSVSGGKEYHLALITLADGRCLLIKRFGKAGRWGVMQVERYEDQTSALSAYAKKMRDKFQGEYTDHYLDKSWDDLDTMPKLRAVLGEGYWNKMGAGNIEWMLPGTDTTGVHDESIETDQYRKVIPKKPLTVKPVLPTAEERVIENPLWGMF